MSQKDVQTASALESRKPKATGWIGVDLDSTLAIYDHWRGPTHIGQPIDKMTNRVKSWIESGQEVRVFTARAYPVGIVFDVDDVESMTASTPREAESLLAIQHIRSWCLQHIGKVLTVTCIKDFSMIELWDDRAIQLSPNTGERVDGSGT